MSRARALVPAVAVLVGIVAACWLLHVPASAILGSATIVTLLMVSLSYACGSILNGLVSGWILEAEHLLRPGDRISVNGLIGTVDGPPRVRTTHLRGDFGEDIILPNATLFTSPIVRNPPPPAPPAEPAKEKP